MTRIAATLAFAVAVPLLAQAPVAGYICGTILDENGHPANGVDVVASYLGAHSGGFPITRTDSSGHYCLTGVPFGRNVPIVEDPQRGYPATWESFYTSDAVAQNIEKQAVTLSAASRGAMVNFSIPYKAASLTIHLTDARTGAPLSVMIYSLDAQADPEHRHKSGSQATADAILVPPNENILVRLRAPGYREWPYDSSDGHNLNLMPGEQLTIDVSLEPK